MLYLTLHYLHIFTKYNFKIRLIKCNMNLIYSPTPVGNTNPFLLIQLQFQWGYFAIENRIQTQSKQNDFVIRKTTNHLDQNFIQNYRMLSTENKTLWFRILMLISTFLDFKWVEMTNKIEIFKLHWSGIQKCRYLCFLLKGYLRKFDLIQKNIDYKKHRFCEHLK